MSGIQTSTTFQLDGAALQAALTGQGGPVYQAVQRAGARVRDVAKLNLTESNLIRTGELRNSIESETGVRGDAVVSRVGTNVPYSIYVHEGTSGPIVPRTARVLRFRGQSGAFVFTPSVRGTRDTGRFRPFLVDALNNLTLDDFID